MVVRLPSSSDGQAGFTLIELLVVLTIIGLLLALAPIHWSVALGGAKVKAEARAMADALRDARGAAVLSGRQITIMVDGAAGNYVVEPDGRSHVLPQGIRLSMEGAGGVAEADKGSVTFFPDGTSTGGAIRLSAVGTQRRVAVHWLTGRVSLDD